MTSPSACWTQRPGGRPGCASTLSVGLHCSCDTMAGPLRASQTAQRGHVPDNPSPGAYGLWGCCLCGLGRSLSQHQWELLLYPSLDRSRPIRSQENALPGWVTCAVRGVLAHRRASKMTEANRTAAMRVNAQETEASLLREPYITGRLADCPGSTASPRRFCLAIQRRLPLETFPAILCTRYIPRHA
jgi:hypothetical protein